MRSAPPRSALLAAIAVSFAAFVLYRYTAAPDLTLVDSAELALAATTGGIAHPPGFPLFLLTGRLFAAMPFAEPVRMLNLMSAFFVALTCGTVLLSVERMLALADRAGGGAPAGGAPGGGKPGGGSPDVPNELRILSGAVAAIAFATAWNPWVWSGVTEVYALNVFLLGAAWACAWCGIAALVPAQDMRPAPGAGPARRTGGTVSAKAWRWITAAAALASLSLANHHATGVLAFPVLLAMLAWVRPRIFRTARFWATVAATVAGALALYLYLFVAARQDVALRWGGIENASQLLRHVSGRQYSLQMGTTSGEALRVARLFFGTLVTGVGWTPAVLVAAAGVLGLRRLLLRPRARGKAGRSAHRASALVVWAPLAMIALNLVLSMLYVAGPEDRMAYDLPATVAWCLLAGVGAYALLGRWGRPGLRRVVAVVLAGLVVFLNVRHHFDACNLREERSARLLVEESLRDVGPGGVVLTAEWNLYAPYLYLRHVEGFRPDVRMIDVLMMRRFWYMDYLERAYPDLLAASRETFDPLRDEIVRFDLGESYDATTIQQKYDRALLRWIAIGIEGGGAFLDVSCYEHPQELNWINARYTAPAGLLIRFLADSSPVANEPLAPYDRDNLTYLRARITERTVERDLSDLPERHHPYFRVWRNYQAAVETSLLVATRTDREAFDERVRAYGAWFPAIERAAAHALDRAASAGR